MGTAGVPSDASTPLLVIGAPNAGKSRYAFETLIAAMREYGPSQAVLAVSNRQEAARLSDEVIRILGPMSQARPVTTLSAVAFQIIAAARMQRGAPLPKLLNGAEQDALLRQVIAEHLAHVRMGEPCDTCMLLREYFSVADWTSMMSDASILRDHADSHVLQDHGVGEKEYRNTGGAEGTGVFASSISDAFVMQLRDMLSRIDELGVSPQHEGKLLVVLGRGTWSPNVERLHVQWRLAFALRKEYEQAITVTYPNEYRLDASKLLVEGAASVGAVEVSALPHVVIVDDCQDLTLAGFAFLEALRDAGVRLTMVGNPDEAVQTFRGSYPEYLFAQAKTKLGASVRVLPMERQQEGETSFTYRDLIVSRISLSICSPIEEELPIPQRPGKLPILPGSLPIVPLSADDPLLHDGSLSTSLYRSSKDELEDVVWRIKRTHLADGRAWNDMVVIAHDNATVRLFGERLRKDGVPVRYSSVNRPLKDEPFVQGLFALLELAWMRNRGTSAINMSLHEAASFVRSRVRMLMECPLITIGGSRDREGRPARLSPVETAMESLASLYAVAKSSKNSVVSDRALDGALQNHATQEHGNTIHDEAEQEVQTSLEQLEALWRTWRDRFLASRSSHIEIDNTLIDGTGAPLSDINAALDAADENMAFNLEALYLLLEFDADGSGGTDSSLASIRAICGSNPHATAFAHVWNLVDRVSRGLLDLPSQEPQYVLSLAWDACDVAACWQREALDNSDIGRAANDRLDAAMRLFEYAKGSAAKRNLTDFLRQVRAMRIEADSLAKVAPVDQAVTLTTPAGAAGRRWPLVWIPALQQGVWPNLAARNTLFGGEELAEVVLFGTLAEEHNLAVDTQFESVLFSEQKSLLVALTRGSEHVTVSAVYNDDLMPSDFLYGYLPERFDRTVQSVASGRTYVEVGDEGRFAGLDSDPRGLIAAARATLAVAPVDSPESRDAVETLRLLVKRGIAEADPANWPFIQTVLPPNTSVIADPSTLQTVRDEPATHDVSTAHDVQTVQAARDAQNTHDVYYENGVDHQADDRKGSSTSTSSANAIGTRAKLMETERSSKTVSLSPSAVDGIWACPVCWLMENRFAGPRAGSVSTSFGSIIHAVAQQASEEGLDLPSFQSDLTESARVDAIRNRMMEIYQHMRGDTSSIDDPAQRYAALRKDETVEDVLGSIAGYFVASNTSAYPVGNVKNFTVGVLESAQCEQSFNAKFSLNDILKMYNTIDSVEPISRATLMSIMGTLVGGWPQGMSEDLVIRLSGRIDRMETRLMSDGKEHIRLVDYKTGSKLSVRAAAVFNDLQLVCYQLGLTFPETGPRGSAALSAMPPIAQSVLFYVASDDAPAKSYGQESLYQPSLFANGHLNDNAFTPRFHYKELNKLADVPDLEETPPSGVSIEDWRYFLSLRGTQAVWALTMIARVFYAAAASRSTVVQAHPLKSHITVCRMKTVCPACAGQVDTVFEVRQS